MNKYWSTVIVGLPPHLNKTHLTPYVYIPDESTGEPMKNSEGNYMTRPHNQYDQELNKMVIAKWATPITVYRNMHCDTKKITNHIKTISTTRSRPYLYTTEKKIQTANSTAITYT